MVDLISIVGISIHTSTREVTGGRCKSPDSGTISIHTSTREVTSPSAEIEYSPDFNPHFHKGSDLFLVSFAFQNIAISIHTSTREVTKKDRWSLATCHHFNPHFHKGSDPAVNGTDGPGCDFNPHFHKGSD